MSDHPYTSRVQAVAALLDVAEAAANHADLNDDSAGVIAVRANVINALRTIGVGAYDIDAAEALRARRLQ